MYIHIENPSITSKISLSEDVDNFCGKALDREFVGEEDVAETYEKTHKLIIEYLNTNKANYHELVGEIQVTKTEDTYHPYGMLDNLNSIDEYFNLFIIIS